MIGTREPLNADRLQIQRPRAIGNSQREDAPIEMNGGRRNREERDAPTKT